MGNFFSRKKYSSLSNNSSKLLLYDDLNDRVIKLNDRINILENKLVDLEKQNHLYQNIIVKHNKSYTEIQKDLNNINDTNINNSKLYRTINVIVNKNERDITLLKENVDILKKREEFNSVYSENLIESNIQDSID